MLIIWLQGIWLPLHGYSFEETPLWAGIFMLPEGFRPASVKVRVVPEGSAPIEREFMWKDIINQGDK